MDGMTWSREEVKELKKLRLDPVRNTLAKFRLLVAHLLKPGSSVFAVTEGDGPIRVSKALARKVRDLALNGDLDWVVGGGPRKEGSDPLAEPWATLLWRYPGSSPPPLPLPKAIWSSRPRPKRYRVATGRPSRARLPGTDRATGPSWRPSSTGTPG